MKIKFYLVWKINNIKELLLLAELLMYLVMWGEGHGS